VNQSLPCRYGLIHIAWVGYGFTGGRIGELRAFPHPLGEMWRGQPAKEWEWACVLHERPGHLGISCVQSFTEAQPDGWRAPMRPEHRLRLMRGLLHTAAELGYAWVEYEDWKGTRPRPRRLRARRET
jgi:hypothetical protein